jgi:AcrR family transcriptional regulator
MKKKAENAGTEERIVRAAVDVFTRKGRAGGRMQDIADRAGINKALLHYYFRSKDRLFKEVFKRVVPVIFSDVFKIMGEDIPLFEKIEKFTASYMDVIEEHPHFPLFVVRALEGSPDLFADTVLSTFEHLGFNPVKRLEEDIRNEAQAGVIGDIDARHLMVNIMSMSIFPFVLRPFLTRIAFEGDGGAYDRFLEERKKEVARFVISAIRKK